ncbi:MAG: GNAT family acetyltransferase [Rhodospirillales bacterium]|nr:GNAT family acetyltransferase [Rhodospirillales bacterium]
MNRRGRKGETLKVRSYREADKEAVMGLWEACGLTTAWNDAAQDIALFHDSADAEILLGETGGKLAATVAVGHDGHRGWVYYLGVDPERRGKGLGAAIMTAAEDWLRQRSVPKLQLMVRPNNLDVKRFYAAIGYQPNPCHLMQKWLDGRAAPRIETERDDGKLDIMITYLEMTERPPHPHVVPPHGTKLALLRARNPTVGFYRFLYDSVGGPWLWWERRAMDDATLGAIIGDERVEIYVLYVAGVPAGYAELDRRHPPDIELAYFGLMPDFIGRGLGRYLLTWAIDTAWSNEPERLWVNTNTLDHPKALALYQRCGFRPYKQEAKIFDDPRITGLIPIA